MHVNYTTFFVAVLGVGIVVFIGIIGAAWMSAVDHHDVSRPTNPLGALTKPKTDFSETISTDAIYYTPIHSESSITSTNGIQPSSEIDSTSEASETTYQEAKSKEGRSSSTSRESLIINDETKTISIPPPILNTFDQKYRETSCQRIELTDDKGDIIPDYNNENGCIEWIIKYEEGYNVDLTIQMLDLDITTKDFLLISSGPDISNDEGNPIFTGRLNETRQYRIPSTGMAYILLVTHKNEKQKPEGFSIRYRRQGELTTEQPTTTPSSVPVPPENSNDTIIVRVLCNYCQLIHGEERDNVIMPSSNETAFKRELALKTKEFCEKENITLQDTVTEANVYITSKWPCIQSWPDGEKCIQMQIAIAVNHTSSHYELTKEHLQKLWDAWDGPLFMQKFLPPLYKTHTIIWTLSIVMFFILMFASIFYLWRCYLNCTSKKEKEDFSETSSNMEVPPFFSNVDEQMDEPEFVTHFARYSVATESSTDEAVIYDKRPFSGDSCGTPSVEENIKKGLSDAVETGELGPISMFVGIRFTEPPIDVLQMDEGCTNEMLCAFDMSDNNGVFNPGVVGAQLDEEGKHLCEETYLSDIDSVIYISTSSQPELSSNV